MFCEFADVPVCKSKGPVVHGVGKGEMVDVLCQVTANPVTNVKFHWTFNNSADFIHVPGTHHPVFFGRGGCRSSLYWWDIFEIFNKDNQNLNIDKCLSINFVDKHFFGSKYQPKWKFRLWIVSVEKITVENSRLHSIILVDKHFLRTINVVRIFG